MTTCKVDETTIPFRDGSLRVLSVGDGPTLGYLHGFIGNEGPPPILEVLANATGMRVVAPSLPGFSGSPRVTQLRSIHDWVVATSEIIDLAGIDGQPVVASCIGGMLALEVAAVRPDAFPQLHLVAPFGLWNPDAPVADPLGRTISDQRALLTVDVERTSAFFDDHSADPAGLVDERVNRYVARTVSASLVWPIPDFGLAERLHRVACQVTLTWGAADSFIPPSYLDAYAASLPNVVGRHVVEGAGHLVDWDRPDELARIVAEHLSEGATVHA